ncbi:MAG: hypothetical protein ACOZCP_09165 [Pseudomonadota bacterium]
MRKLKVHRISVLLLLSLGCGARVLAAELDIAPLFAGYERGCGISGVAERLVVWTNPDGKDRLPSADALPAVWWSHVGKPVVSDQADHWYVRVPLRQVRFRGLQVVRLERWYGKGSGISGWSLVLAVPLVEARRHIDEREFTLDESGNFKPELSADEDGRHTHLVCDVSM